MKIGYFLTFKKPCVSRSIERRRTESRYSGSGINGCGYNYNYRYKYGPWNYGGGTPTRPRETALKTLSTGYLQIIPSPTASEHFYFITLAAAVDQVCKKVITGGVV